MNNDIQEVLFSKNEIEQKVKELAKQISEDYKGKNLLVIGILKGSVFFTCDLVRFLDIPCRVEFMQVSSYGDNAVSSGNVNIVSDISFSLDGYDVLILEDIIETGTTLAFLSNLILNRGAKSVKICSFLHKPDSRKLAVDVSYFGFETPDEFLVGYGLDYAQKYRQLPFIAVLKQEIYQS